MPAMVTTSSSSSASATKGWVRGGCIGRGSFGSVSLAFDKASKAVFAVKSVICSDDPRSNSSLRSLENEVMIYKFVNSPYIVSYLGDDVTIESSGEVCRNIHLEYMSGGTVTDVAKKVGECDVRSYARCLTEALRCLHAGGIVHGDVKGRNVLIGHTPGSAKLTDFGSARRLFDGPKKMGEIGLSQGTPLWMAPEVVRGEPQSPESDVWSLGCTVIEMVTGEAPWANHQRCDTAEGTLFRIGFGDELPEVPEKMSKLGRDFVGKCLRRNPKERWSCEELLKHPFLSSTVEMETSPRCVLDWIGSEFGFDDDDDDELDDSYGYDDVIVDLIDVKRRIEGLAMGCGVVVDWEDDGDDWEVVRGEEEENNDDDDDDGETHKKMVSLPPLNSELEVPVRCSDSGSTSGLISGSYTSTCAGQVLKLVKLCRKDICLGPQVELCKSLLLWLPSLYYLWLPFLVEIKWEEFVVSLKFILLVSIPSNVFDSSHHLHLFISDMMLFHRSHPMMT